ncbi:probable transcription factor bHLH115 [Coccomyxa sp. Obi]|nr:probable transcription factor bHLH115 [Coccomyxa sp. Obi]
MLEMENNWVPGQDNFSPSGGLLNYQWSDTLLQMELDEMHLLESQQAQAQARRAALPQTRTASPAEASPAMFFEEPQPSLDEEDRRKRTRETIERDSLETFLKDLGRETQQQQGSGGSGGHTPTAAKHDQTAQSEEKGKRSHHLSDSSAAARTKAGRERARRERLNDSFAELSKVLEPGKAAKTDKSSIITDAIRVVTQLRAENGQLRQLNKFLEERVGTVEKQKSELMMQAALMQQAGPSHVVQMPGHYAAGMAVGQPVQGIPAQGLPSLQPSADGSVPAHAGMQGYVTHNPSMGVASSSGLNLLPLSPSPGRNSGGMADFAAGGPGPSGAPGMVPGIAMGPMRWLPATTMDTSQDSLRRPPAA